MDMPRNFDDIELSATQKGHAGNLKHLMRTPRLTRRPLQFATLISPLLAILAVKLTGGSNIEMEDALLVCDSAS